MHRQEVDASVSCITKNFMVRVDKTSGQLLAAKLVSPGAASADGKLRRSFPELTPLDTPKNPWPWLRKGPAKGISSRKLICFLSDARTTKQPVQAIDGCWVDSTLRIDR